MVFVSHQLGAAEPAVSKQFDRPFLQNTDKTLKFTRQNGELGLNTDIRDTSNSIENCHGAALSKDQLIDPSGESIGVEYEEFSLRLKMHLFVGGDLYGSSEPAYRQNSLSRQQSSAYDQKGCVAENVPIRLEIFDY